MTHPFEIELETTLAASPEQVWEAIATGPGIDSWFMGRNQVDPREGGTASMETGGHRENALITAYEPGVRFATRTSPGDDGRFMAFEYLIEGREGGSTVLRVVHSGLLGDDWQDEYDALRRGWPFHLHTLGVYLTHFAGRAGVPVFAMAPTGTRSAEEVRAALADALGLALPVAPGARAEAEPVRGGEVVWADEERFELRAPDAIYGFHQGPGIVLMFHHLFGAAGEAAGEAAADADKADAQWRQWLTDVLN